MQKTRSVVVSVVVSIAKDILNKWKQLVGAGVKRIVRVLWHARALNITTILARRRYATISAVQRSLVCLQALRFRIGGMPCSIGSTAVLSVEDRMVCFSLLLGWTIGYPWRLHTALAMSPTTFSHSVTASNLAIVVRAIKSLLSGLRRAWEYRRPSGNSKRSRPSLRRYARLTRDS